MQGWTGNHLPSLCFLRGLTPKEGNCQDLNSASGTGYSYTSKIIRKSGLQMK
jgi:hypothetical protein